jgi:deazaflavin-dependent oxidoreductase (nitroreductase family)
MTKRFRMSALRKMGNFFIGAATLLGIGPRNTHILTTVGRKSGTPHSHPVSLVFEGADRYLVAPYGEVDWVKNARAAGVVELRRGSKTETFTIRQVAPHDAGRVLKAYVGFAPIVLPYFEASKGSPPEAFAKEADAHPVFLLTQN